MIHGRDPEVSASGSFCCGLDMSLKCNFLYMVLKHEMLTFGQV